MSRRMNISITMIAILVIAIGIILALLFQRANTSPKTQTLSNGIEIPSPLPAPIAPIVPPNTITAQPPGPVEQNATAVAIDFGERYGSFSSEQNYQNLRDLESQMTPSLQISTNAFIAEHPLPASPFQGFTVRILHTDVISKTDTAISLKLGAQRITTTGTDAPKTSYPTAQISLVKSGTKWLVDTFTWD